MKIQSPCTMFPKQAPAVNCANLLSLPQELLLLIFEQLDPWACYTLLRVSKHVNAVANKLINLGPVKYCSYTTDSYSKPFIFNRAQQGIVNTTDVSIHFLFTKPFRLSAHFLHGIRRNAVIVPHNVEEDLFVIPACDKICIDVIIRWPSSPHGDGFRHNHGFRYLIRTHFGRGITVSDVTRVLIPAYSWAASIEDPLSYYPFALKKADEDMRDEGEAMSMTEDDFMLTHNLMNNNNKKEEMAWPGHNVLDKARNREHRARSRDDFTVKNLTVTDGILRFIINKIAE